VEEELEIIENPDGTSTIKVVRSKKNCREVSRPFEQAKGEVGQTKPIENPGTKQGQGLSQGR
jgi:hypothetical protein